MKITTKSEKETCEIEVPKEYEYYCDSCKRLICKQSVETTLSALRKKNPIKITYFKVSADDTNLLHPDLYCEDCLIDELKDTLKNHEEVKIEKVQDFCYELGEDYDKTK